jgi:hypothetical protein
MCRRLRRSRMNSGIVTWSWQRKSVTPEDILTAARTLELKPNWYEVDLTSDWKTSSDYLNWGRQCFQLQTEFSSDSALNYAKRAACREIDGFMVRNHLSHLIRAKYPEKIEMLCDVGISIPEVVHELVIEPRNEVEHKYRAWPFGLASRTVKTSALPPPESRKIPMPSECG